MSSFSRYFLSSAITNKGFLDLRLDIGDLSLGAQNATVTGTAQVDWVFADQRTSVDFTGSGAGVDVLYLDGNLADYTLSVSASVLTLTRTVGDATSTYKIQTAEDKVVFANGSATTADLSTNFSTPELVALNTAETSTTLPSTEEVSTAASRVRMSNGGVMSVAAAGPMLVVSGGNGVESVYVRAGGKADLQGLGGGVDKIYLNGMWADYTKTLSAGLITFERTVGGLNEKVVVAASAESGGGNDLLFFADGNIRSQAAQVALSVDSSVSLAAAGGLTNSNGDSRTPVTLAVARVAALSDDTGDLASDFLTNQVLQTITGTFTGRLSAGDKVQLRLGNGLWQDAALSDVSTVGGKFSLAGVSLVEGSRSLEVRTLAANGLTRLGTGTTVTLDTDAPEGSLSVAAGENNLVNSNEAQITLRVTDMDKLQVGDRVRLQLGGSDIEGIEEVEITQEHKTNGLTLVVSKDKLSEGAGNLFTLVARDKAGNTSRSTDLAITLDTEVPAPTLSVSDVNADNEAITGLASDAYLNAAENAVVLKVALTRENAGQSVKEGDFLQLQVEGANLGGRHTVTADDVARGFVLFTVNKSDLGERVVDAAYRVTVIATDLAGNSAQSELNLTVDTSAPAAQLTLSDTQASGDPFGEGVNNDATLTLAEGTVVLKLEGDASVLGGGFKVGDTVTLQRLNTDTNEWTDVKKLDASGNVTDAVYSARAANDGDKLYLEVTVTDLPTGLSNLRVVSKDLAGNQSQSVSLEVNRVVNFFFEMPETAITSLDVDGQIVINAESLAGTPSGLQVVSGGKIRLVHSTDASRTQELDVTDARFVTVSGSRVIIKPPFDFDFGAGYRVEVDANAFTATVAGVAGTQSRAMVAADGLSFGTVNINSANNVANAAQGQVVNDDGTVLSGKKWINGSGRGDWLADQAAEFDLSGGDYAVVVEDAGTLGGRALQGDGVQGDGFNLDLRNVGSGDRIYVDDKANDKAALNNRDFTQILGNSSGGLSIHFNESDTASNANRINIKSVEGAELNLSQPDTVRNLLNVSNSRLGTRISAIERVGADADKDFGGALAGDARFDVKVSANFRVGDKVQLVRLDGSDNEVLWGSEVAVQGDDIAQGHITLSQSSLSALMQGRNVIYAKVTGADGAVSKGPVLFSRQGGFDYDTTPPVPVLSVAPTQDEALTDGGASVLIQVLGWTVGDKLQLKLAGNNLGDEITITRDMLDNNLQLYVRVNKSDLAGVEQSITATLTDRSGNVGATASALVLEVPAAPTFTFANDTGAVGDDGITNDGQINVSGLVAGGTWAYSIDGGATWQAGSGASFSLNAGSYAAGAVQVRQTNTAGTSSTINRNAAQVVIDNQAPTITSIYEVAENTAADPTPKRITLAADESLTWSGLSGADAADFTLNSDGTLSFNATTNFDLKNTYSVSVTGTDTAGNARTQALVIKLTDVPTPPNSAPVARNGLVSATEDTNFVFTADQFGFADSGDVPANALSAVIISRLPSAGTLKLDGVDVTLNQVISKADIDAGKLVFRAAENANGDAYTTLGFKVQDDGGTANGGVDTSEEATLTFNVAAVDDAATGALSIVGTMTQGEVLSIDTSSIADRDGLGAFGYKWFADGVEISGQTGASLTLGQALVGKRITAQMQFTDGGGAVNTFTAVAAGGAAPRVVSLGAGNGQLIGQVSVDNNQLFYYWDRNGDGLANDAMSMTALAGIFNRNSTFNSTGAGASATFRFAEINGVRLELSNGSAAFDLRSGTSISGSADNPTYNGVLAVWDAFNGTGTGTGLSGVPADWNNLYYWIASGNLGGGVYENFRLADGYRNTALQGANHHVALRLLPSSGSYVAPVGVVDVNDAPTGEVTIANSTSASRGTATLLHGDVLTVSNTLSDADGLSTAAGRGVTYQWLADGVAIVGATGSSLTLTEAHAGRVITVQASYVDNGGWSNSMTSSATAAVVQANPPAFALANDTGVSTTDGISSDGLINVTGLLSGATWEYSTDRGVNWQSGSGSSFTLSPGTYDAGTVQVRQTTLDGKTSPGAVRESAIVIDTAAPLQTALITTAIDDAADQTWTAAASEATRIASSTDNGGNNRITVSATVSGDYTVGGWFRTDSLNVTAVQQVFRATGKELFMRNGRLFTWGGSGAVVDAGAIPDTGWNHYAMTTNGTGSWDIYVNGVLVQTAAGGNVSTTPNTQTVNVGNHGAANNSLNGLVGNVQIWDTRRSAAEIAQDMLSVTSTNSNLKGSWLFGSQGGANLVTGGATATLGSATTAVAIERTYRSDDSTQDLRGSLSAVLAEGETVVIFDGAVELGTATIDTGGRTWRFTTPELSGGLHTLTARIRDAAGNLAAAAVDGRGVTKAYVVEIDLPASPLASSATYSGDELTLTFDVPMTVSAVPGDWRVADGATTINSVVQSGSDNNVLTFAMDAITPDSIIELTYEGAALTDLDGEGLRHNTMWVAGGADDILDASAADTAVALFGNDGGDTLTGGAEADKLVGGQGNDVLTGGAGGDVFAFINGEQGQDTITDFDKSEGDVLDLSLLLDGSGMDKASLVSVSTYLQLSQSGDDAVLKIDVNGSSDFTAVDHTITMTNAWASGGMNEDIMQLLNSGVILA